MVEIADNQKQIIQTLSQQNAIFNLGHCDDITASKQAEMVADVLKDHAAVVALSDVSSRICDGRGAFAVVEHMFPVKFNRKNLPVTLHLATLDHCDDLFRWQCEPDARVYSRDPKPPEYDAHCTWYQNSLKNSQRHLYIVYCDQKPCGMVRLDTITDQIDRQGYEVSVLISSGYQGQSIAKLALDLLRIYHPNKNFWAYVMAENEKSVSLFRKAGYKASDDANWYISAGFC